MQDWWTTSWIIYKVLMACYETPDGTVNDADEIKLYKTLLLISYVEYTHL
jgi:hypothetical protein